VLELLAASGVKEIYVFCCAHAQQIKNYIQKSEKWNNTQLGVVVKTVESQAVKSAGDALRFFHAADLITNDFVLIAGDVISNIDLKPIIAQHKYVYC
jgi:translation initiation factor eIF-2B subunit epsilon